MEILEHVPLAPLTTLEAGGPARWFAEATSEDDLVAGAEFASQRSLPLFILGGGSNLLVADVGFQGLVLKVGLRGVARESDEIFHAAAGEDWDRLVQATVEADCAGMECLSGIPGTVGGTPVQNVGAYGQDVSETIVEVRALDLENLTWHSLTNAECEFAYRRSRFNSREKGKWIVARVSFQLRKGGAAEIRYPDLKELFAGADEVGKPSLAAVRRAVLEIRRRKGMVLAPGDPERRSAGSYFKNPIVVPDVYAEIQEKFPAETVPKYEAEGKIKLSAAWLMEHAGFRKGQAFGNAGLSNRHILAVVNRGGATAKEILELEARIVEGVSEKFGVLLEREPVLLG